MSSLGYGDSEWESSFTQILSRTKQNLNRINQRYSSIALPPSFPISKNETSEIPSHEVKPFNSLVPSQVLYSERKYQSSPPRILNGGNKHFIMDVNSDEKIDHEQKLLDRLSEKLISQIQHQLLKSPDQAQNFPRSKEYEALQDQLRALSESNDSLQKEVRNLTSKLSACSGAVEALTFSQKERDKDRDRDRESGRGAISKLESWVRQEEAWREQTEEKLTGVR